MEFFLRNFVDLSDLLALRFPRESSVPSSLDNLIFLQPHDLRLGNVVIALPLDIDPIWKVDTPFLAAYQVIGDDGPSILLKRVHGADPYPDHGRINSSFVGVFALNQASIGAIPSTGPFQTALKIKPPVAALIMSGPRSSAAGVRAAQVGGGILAPLSDVKNRPQDIALIFMLRAFSQRDDELRAVAGSGESTNVLTSMSVRAEMRNRLDKQYRNLSLFANQSCFESVLQGRCLRERPTHKSHVFSHFCMEMVCPFGADGELATLKTSQELYDTYVLLRNVLMAMFRDLTLFPALFRKNIENFNDRNLRTGFGLLPFSVQQSAIAESLEGMFLCFSRPDLRGLSMSQWMEATTRISDIDPAQLRAEVHQALEAIALTSSLAAGDMTPAGVAIAVAAGLMGPPPPPRGAKHPAPADDGGAPPAKITKRGGKGNRGGGKKALTHGAPAPAPAAPAPAPAPTPAPAGDNTCLAHLAFLLKVNLADCSKVRCPLPHIPQWRYPISPTDRATLSNHCARLKAAGSQAFKAQMLAAINALP